MTIGRLLVGSVGLVTTFAAAALLLAPEWAYEAFGQFPPYNRHYSGDLGAFMLPVGVSLLIVASHPVRWRGLLLLGLAASWLHALNHAYDGLVHPALRQAGLVDVAMVVAVAITLTVGAWLTRGSSA